MHREIKKNLITANVSRPSEASRAARIGKRARHEFQRQGSSSGINRRSSVLICGHLGHTSTKMVERRYGHLARSFIVDAVRDYARVSAFRVRARSESCVHGRRLGERHQGGPLPVQTRRMVYRMTLRGCANWSRLSARCLHVERMMILSTAALRRPA